MASSVEMSRIMRPQAGWPTHGTNDEVEEPTPASLVYGRDYASRDQTVYAIPGLVAASIIWILLAVQDVCNWTFPSKTYHWFQTNQANVQPIVQLAANTLGLVHTSALGILINRTTRYYWSRKTDTRSHLQCWHALCTRTFVWDLPMPAVEMLVLYILSTATIPAMWAGAITPIPKTVLSGMFVAVPTYYESAYMNISSLGSDEVGPILRNRKGQFGFAEGTQMQGSLLASAASAMTLDSSARRHVKLDSSGYRYVGRPYGLGASIGVLDEDITRNDLNVVYGFHEIGYKISMDCAYNLNAVRWPDKMRCSSHGPFVGQSETAVTKRAGVRSTEVTSAAQSDVRLRVDLNISTPMLTVSAGGAYGHLDGVQCRTSFLETEFAVDTDTITRTITVEIYGNASYVDGGKAMRDAMMRQVKLVTSGGLGVNSSLVGDSLNRSISDYIIASNSTDEPSLQEATLRGLENACEAMADDILIALASAQLLIIQDFDEAPAILQTNVMKAGECIFHLLTGGLHFLIVAGFGFWSVELGKESSLTGLP